MNVIARIVCFAQSCRTLGIANQLVKVENTIECICCADPSVHRLADCLAFRPIRICSLKGHYCGPKNSDPMFMCACDDLLETRDNVIGGDQFRRKNVLFDIGYLQLGHSDPWETNVVNAFENDEVGDTGKGQDILVETGQCANSCAVVKYSVSTDSLIYNRNPRTCFLTR